MVRIETVGDVDMDAWVVAVAAGATHDFSKPTTPSIRLVVGEGVVGDAHRGVTVKHRSRVAADPTQPNLRQVHLIHAELFDELAGKGFDVTPGRMGENVTTRGVDLLGLPKGTRLRIGETLIEITGLRNPCVQIDGLAKGLMAATLDHGADGSLIRKAGVMGIVVEGGDIRPGDAIATTLPPTPHRALEPV
jgi:MOSC domain-containing protein YiiM